MRIDSRRAFSRLHRAPHNSHLRMRSITCRGQQKAPRRPFKVMRHGAAANAVTMPSLLQATPS